MPVYGEGSRYHLCGGSGLSARPELAACLLSNRFLAMITNGDLVHIAQDLWPIARRTIRAWRSASWTIRGRYPLPCSA